RSAPPRHGPPALRRRLLRARGRIRARRRAPRARGRGDPGDERRGAAGALLAADAGRAGFRGDPIFGKRGARMAAGPGKGFVNTSLDELRWTENPKGRHCTWHMTWDEGDGLDHPVVSVLEYAPGAVVPPHYHESDYVSVVLAGDLSVDGRPHKVGDIRFV